MDVQNDNHIPGRHTTQAIIQERGSYYSKPVSGGQLYNYPTIKLREHGDWRHGWQLTARQKEPVESFGFSYVDVIRLRRHDRDLLLSLIKRWLPGRNTFQLSIGEIPITLADVTMILGLSITDIPIYFEEGINVGDLIRTYLVVEPKLDQGTSSGIKMTWLRTNFMHVHRIENTPVPADKQRGLFTKLVRCIVIFLRDGK